MKRYIPAAKTMPACNQSILEVKELEHEITQPNAVSVLQPEPGIVGEAGQSAPRSPTAPECTSGQEAGCSAWRVFTSTFITIFLAELGDKTQVSTLLMSAEFHKPWIVFLGAAMALITTTLVGVLLGRWLSTRLSPRTLDVAAGIMLALIAAWLLWDVVQM